MKALMISIALISIFGCHSDGGDDTEKITFPKIDRHPASDEYSFLQKDFNFLPKYDPEMGEIDVRCFDLTSMNLTDQLDNLLLTTFDSKTKWGSTLPSGFDPSVIMELNKNPGVGLSQLHNEGITGKEIGIAIIDGTLLVDHVDYKDRVMLYEEIPVSESPSEMHGPAVASIALGNTTGVAPEANLFYIAADLSDPEDPYSDSRDFHNYAKAVYRVLEINKSLDENKKIKIISLSVGWVSEEKGYKEFDEAIKVAIKNGIFVVSVNSLDNEYNGCSGWTIEKAPLKDPEDPTSYEPCSWWKEYFIENSDDFVAEENILIPSSRTTASPTGINDYVYYRSGGMSWAIPYIAGLYALSLQVKPDITSDVFYKTILETGESIDLVYSGKTYKFGKIVNALKAIRSLQGK